MWGDKVAAAADFIYEQLHQPAEARDELALPPFAPPSYVVQQIARAGNTQLFPGLMHGTGIR